MAGKTYRGRSQADVLAELTAMRAAGEISPDEFKAAREKVLQGDEQPAAIVRERVVKVERNKKSGGCGTVLIGIVVVLVIVGIIGSQSKTGSSSSSTTASSTTAAETAERAEDKRKGFHCLSAWDGSFPDLARRIKDNLREPSSFEHVETRITPVNEKGQHTVLMTYRGRNGFGGMNVETAIGVISNDGCRLLSVTTE